MVALTACTTPAPEDDGGPPRGLAGRPESLAPEPTAAGSASSSRPPRASGSVRPSRGSGSPAASLPGSRPTTAAPTGGGTPSPGGPTYGPFSEVGAVDDRRGDAGAATAAYADILSITIEDDGTYARVTVRAAGTFPSAMPADETMGVGVEFYRTRLQNESDYQLFADGQPDGWFAYLHTPKGFVRYPGTFGLGGDRLVFTVPWSALGSPAGGTFAGFVDWTRRATPQNVAGEDRAPELARQPYQR